MESGRKHFLDARIPPPVIELAAALLMWGAARAWPGLRMDLPGRTQVAVAVALAGIAMAIAGIVEFRRARTTVNPLRPERSSALVDSGAYRFTRNPMYLGMAIVLAGWAIWLGSAPALLVLPFFVAYLTRFQILAEERALQARFGDAFRAYRRRVRRWL